MNCSTFLRSTAVTRALLAIVSLTFHFSVRGQAPAWAEVITGSPTQSGTSLTRAIAADASDNVFVTGQFTGQVAFGSTLLSSMGGNDLFVAKYVPASGTWAWAQSGGGIGDDYGSGVAVSGTNVYVTGQLTNNAANANGVLIGGTGTTPGTVQVNGASPTNSLDLVLAKYSDNGATATLGWTQVGGGIGDDYGNAVVMSGQNVLVAGSVVPIASFGSFAIANPAGSLTTVLTRVVDLTITATTQSLRLEPAMLFPNPARHTVTLRLAAGAASMPLTLTDALGRALLSRPGWARGCARPAGLACWPLPAARRRTGPGHRGGIAHLRVLLLQRPVALGPVRLFSGSYLILMHLLHAPHWPRLLRGQVLVGSGQLKKRWGHLSALKRECPTG